MCFLSLSEIALKLSNVRRNGLLLDLGDLVVQLTCSIVDVARKIYVAFLLDFEIAARIFADYV